MWEQALHLARTQALGTKCYFTAHGFLKALGWVTGKQNHVWLGESLARLGATWVEISDSRRTYFGSLIEGGARDEDTGRYVLKINPKLAKFYGRTKWTQIDWEQRQRLRGKPLALWLHGFYVRRALPVTRCLPAQAQRQPDQAAKAFQAESDQGAAGLKVQLLTGELEFRQVQSTPKGSRSRARLSSRFSSSASANSTKFRPYRA